MYFQHFQRDSYLSLRDERPVCWSYRDCCCCLISWDCFLKRIYNQLLLNILQVISQKYGRNL